MIRFHSYALFLVAALATLGGAIAPARAQAPEEFPGFLKQLRAEALAAGVAASVVDQAFEGVRLNQKVLKFDRHQPEFSQPIWDYLDIRLSEKYIERGRKALEEYSEVLDKIEKPYGVDKEIVAAIWGVESFFGERRGEFDVIEALATLAFEGRRQEFGKQQLIAALKILQNGDVEPRKMVGSWAGAMGHTQFIPSSYQALAVDFGGDGKRDIWSDDPTDALASTAHYLSSRGWVEKTPWGFQVIVPPQFDYSRYADAKQSTSDWAKLGLTLASGDALPAAYDQATLLVPAGADGPAFLVLGNYRALLQYNNANAYALAVALLAERLAGKPPRALNWPRQDKPLNIAERKEIQETLNKLGFDAGSVDGILGSRTKRAIRRFQTTNSMIADGYPSSRLLDDLRRAVAAKTAPLIRVAVGPATDADIREIQGLLSVLGYSVQVDGVNGPRTETALANFIEQRGVNLAAAPSKEVLAELRRAVRKE